MSTVTEIKSAIERLTPEERAEIEALIWPDEETPPNISTKLAEAASGYFVRGNRDNIKKILASLE